MAERIRSGLPRDVLFGAFATGHLVGVVGFYLDKDRQGWVWGMFVHPEFRGQGLGRRLLSEIVQHARSLQDLRELHLMVASSQKPALGLYESCGFSPHAGPFPEGYRGGKCDRHLVLRIVREARAI
ncbi:MAG TPA: GNAT family N-acetyltransferase [Bryobacteraceae bacterium]|nr:GNAT family N-acetyltransferase [Bryobacteraceae bacterium]